MRHFPRACKSRWEESTIITRSTRSPTRVETPHIRLRVYLPSVGLFERLATTKNIYNNIPSISSSHTATKIRKTCAYTPTRGVRYASAEIGASRGKLWVGAVAPAKRATFGFPGGPMKQGQQCDIHNSKHKDDSYNSGRHHPTGAQPGQTPSPAQVCAQKRGTADDYTYGMRIIHRDPSLPFMVTNVSPPHTCTHAHQTHPPLNLRYGRYRSYCSPPSRTLHKT